MNLNGIKLTWLGHATFRIGTPAGKTILVDPWVMGNPMCPHEDKNVENVDVMLCTTATSITSAMLSKSRRSTSQSWLRSPNSATGWKRRA